MAGTVIFIEALIQYTLIVLVIGLFLLICLLLLLYAKDHVTNFLRIRPLKSLFERVCEVSDRLDERYVLNNLYGTAMWLTPLLWKGFGAAAVLISLWVVIAATR